MNPFTALRKIVHHQLDCAHRAAGPVVHHPIIMSPNPLSGKELHVRYEGIVPTDPYANVRVCFAQTAHYEPGHGHTIEERVSLIGEEAKAVRSLFLDEAEKLRAVLTDVAPVVPLSKRLTLPGGRN